MGGSVERGRAERTKEKEEGVGLDGVGHTSQDASDVFRHGRGRLSAHAILPHSPYEFSSFP